MGDPAQIVALLTEAFTVGVVVTFINTVDVFTQPKLFVTFHVYVVLTDGETTAGFDKDPGFHDDTNGPPNVAVPVNVVVFPLHIHIELTETVKLGIGLTANTTV